MFLHAGLQRVPPFSEFQPSPSVPSAGRSKTDSMKRFAADDSFSQDDPWLGQLSWSASHRTQKRVIPSDPQSKSIKNEYLRSILAHPPSFSSGLFPSDGCQPQGSGLPGRKRADRLTAEFAGTHLRKGDIPFLKDVNLVSLIPGESYTLELSTRALPLTTLALAPTVTWKCVSRRPHRAGVGIRQTGTGWNSLWRVGGGQG